MGFAKEVENRRRVFASNLERAQFWIDSINSSRSTSVQLVDAKEASGLAAVYLTGALDEYLKSLHPLCIEALLFGEYLPPRKMGATIPVVAARLIVESTGKGQYRYGTDYTMARREIFKATERKNFQGEEGIHSFLSEVGLPKFKKFSYWSPLHISLDAAKGYLATIESIANDRHLVVHRLGNRPSNYFIDDFSDEQLISPDVLSAFENIADAIKEELLCNASQNRMWD